MAVCGIKCTDVITETIKILSAYFFYNQKFQIEKYFVKRIIIILQNVLNLRTMRNITLELKVIIVKTLALSKLLYLTTIN